MLVLHGIPLSAEQIEKDLSRGKRITKTPDEIIMDFHDQEQVRWLIEKRNPRTAVGVDAQGNWFLVVVEGRQPNCSEGLSLPELAEYMKGLGCVSAINLGGGGDSEMVISDQVVSIPAGGSTSNKIQEERPISDAILIGLKKEAL